jgi:ATP-dependent helicase/nuclease subunit A
MTMAKERLFITLNCSEKRVKKACELAQIIYNEDGITPDISSMVKSMSDWIMMCLVSHDKSAWLREKFGIFESYRYDSDFELKYEEFEDIEFSDEISESEVNDESERVASDPALVEKLEKMIGFRYDDTLSDLTAKLSVSDVSKGISDFDAPLKRPAFMRESGSLTPAEKGTALHTFMQFADFTVLENDFYAELERLYSTGYLTKKQCEVIKKDDIDSFIHSALYKRIRSCKKIHREKKFLIAIDDLELEGEFGDMYRNTSGMLNGIIDMILEFDDYLVLVDYKTDRISDINELAERYSEQIELYRKTLGKTEVKPVRESLIYSFYKKAEIVVD